MDNFELVPGFIFDEEDEGCNNRDFENSPEERALIRKMADCTMYLLLNEYRGRLSEIGTERTYDGKEEEYLKKLNNSFENNDGSFPYFFFTGSRIIEYNSCYQPVSFDNKNDFGLFLFFKLRNCTLHDVEDWLDGLFNKHGNDFLGFLDTHLDEYKGVYQTKWFDFISKWLIRVRENGKINEGAGKRAYAEAPVSTTKKDDGEPYEEVFRMDDNLIEKLVALLAPYFSEEDLKELPSVLKGNPLEMGMKLHFNAVGVRLLEVFRSLHDNRKIICTQKTTNMWICRNFTFDNSKEKLKTPFITGNVHNALCRSSFTINEKKAIDLGSLLQ